MPANPTYFSRDSIPPCVFVAYARAAQSNDSLTITSGGATTTIGHAVVCADGTFPIVGVAQEGTRRAPGTDANDGLAAKYGEQLVVHGPGTECLVTAGGTVKAGDYVTADSTTYTVTGDGGQSVTLRTGKAVSLDIAAGADEGKVYYGGIAQTDAATGEKFRILVQPGAFEGS